VFKKFLEARYDKRIAQKILVLFDWSNPLKFDKFTERILEFFLQPGTGTDNDYMESVRTLKLMAYNLYDMNNDGMLCESDLFSLLRCMQKDRIFSDESQRDEFFKQVLYQDIMDIEKCIRVAKEELIDPVFIRQPD